jgi:hypothetical protein
MAFWVYLCSWRGVLDQWHCVEDGFVQSIGCTKEKEGSSIGIYRYYA